MKKENKIYYYKDELNDDFAGESINPIKITSQYKYLHKNIFWKMTSFIAYRIIATPLAYLYAKIAFGMEIRNKHVLKQCRKKGYFVYINHTQKILDPFIPTLVNFPKKSYVIAHPDNVSMPVLGKAIKMLGALPIPSDLETMKKFLDSIETIVKKDKHVVAVYPEAHVWPYYTKIRNYVSTAFKYPVKFDVPVYSFTTTYLERENRRPKIVIYIDGPFLPNKELKAKQAQEELRDKVHECMVKRSKESNIEYIKYVKIEDEIYD